MSQTRRRFLRQIGAATTMLALGDSAFAAGAAAKDLSAMDYPAFAQRVGHGFQLAQGGKAVVELSLIKVVPLASTKGYADERRARAQCFTLVLQSAQRSSLAEGIYDFSAAGMTTFAAFISPIRGDGRSYQVVFNRT